MKIQPTEQVKHAVTCRRTVKAKYIKTTESLQNYLRCEYEKARNLITIHIIVVSSLGSLDQETRIKLKQKRQRIFGQTSRDFSD
jgi:hypothetical protein